MRILESRLENPKATGSGYRMEPALASAARHWLGASLLGPPEAGPGMGLDRAGLDPDRWGNRCTAQVWLPLELQT